MKSMNTQNQACTTQIESPIQRASSRIMSGQGETQKLIEELKMRISAILHPDCPKACDPSNGIKMPPRETAAPLTDQINDRVGLQDMINTELRDILSRVEL